MGRTSLSVDRQLGVAQAATAEAIVARVDRLPISWWHVKTRIIVGVATFFDAFDALAIASVLPVLVSMWKLSPPQIGLLISAGYLGQLIGALYFGWFAERYGRMTGMVWSIAIFAAMSLICALAWNYESLLIFRVIQGFGLGGEVPIAAAYISELAKPNTRGRFVLLYELVFPIGIVAASVLGVWIVPHFGWQYMFVIGACPAILALFLRRVLPESPRWLASRGRLKDAEAAVSRIEQETVKSTGAALPPIQLRVTVKSKRASLSDLFGAFYLRRTLVVWVIWFTAYLVNYGLMIWMPTVYRTVFNLPLDVSLQYGMITTAVGLLSAVLAALVIDHVGRKPLFAVAFAGGAAALLALAMIDHPTGQQVLLYISIAQFFVSPINLGVYVYTPELYPTRVRALGVGTATAWLRLGSMVGPTAIGLMIASGLQAVFALFGLLAVFAAVVTAAFAVETKQQVLEEISP